MDTLRNEFAPAVGRLLLALLFIWGGWGKATHMADTVGFFAQLHLPLPTAAYYLAVVVELGGGIALLLGLVTRWVALILAVWCVATLAIGHGFGDTANTIQSLKNLAMTGGFLYVFGHGAGAWSLDALLFRGGAARVTRTA
jgi:putative oxidoreductase